MNEYISREEAINVIKSLESSMPAKDNYAKGYDAALGRVQIAVRAVPPAEDVQPVKLGKWECEHYDELIECYVANCSECGYESTDNYRITPNHRYCEYCGTRMIKDGVFE